MEMSTKNNGFELSAIFQTPKRKRINKTITKAVESSVSIVNLRLFRKKFNNLCVLDKKICPRDHIFAPLKAG